MWQINTFGNGDVLSDVFRSLAFFTGASYESLLQFGFLILVLSGLILYMTRGGFATRLFIGGLLILATTVTIRGPVLVHDLVNPWVGDQVVDNVPLAVAFPAYVASELSYNTMVNAETAFGMPAEYRMVNSTIGRGFFDMQKTLMLELVPGDLQRNLTSYLEHCVFREIESGDKVLDTIWNAPDIVTVIGSTNNALLAEMYVNGNQVGFLPCPQMYDQFVVNGLTAANADYAATMRNFRAALGVQDVAGAELGPVTSWLTNISASAQTATQVINNILIRERWHDAEEQQATSGGDVATMLSHLRRSISEDLKYQGMADAVVTGRYVPLLRMISESAVYLLTPLMLALAFTPMMFTSVRGVVMGYGWLFMWIPLYVVYNFATYRYGLQQVTTLGVTDVTMMSFDRYYDMVIGLNSFMGKLIWAVPTMATGIMYGLGSMVSGASSAGSGVQQAASQEATAHAHGQGQFVEDGQHLKREVTTYEDESGHQQTVSTYGHSSGFGVSRQDGSTNYSYSDGSSLIHGVDGTEQYHGPEGSWAKKDGHLVSGAFRQNFVTADGRNHLAQFEVSGDHVNVSYTQAGADGVSHDMHETWDQGMNQRQHLDDFFSRGSLTHREQTLGDGSQLGEAVGTRMIPMKQPNGETRMEAADFHATYSRASEQEPWGNYVATVHSTQHGEFRGTLSEVELDDHGHPDFSRPMTLTSGEGSSRINAQGSSHGLNTSDAMGADGSRQRTYQGPTPLTVVNGDDGSEHTYSNAVVSATGSVAADGHGMPAAGSAVIDDGGFRGDVRGELVHNDKLGRWELHASSQHWDSQHDAAGSGITMKIGDYTAKGGHFQILGDRDHPLGYTYDGPVMTPDGNPFHGHIEQSDGKTFLSSLEAGQTKKEIDASGGTTLTWGRLDSPDGQRVMTMQSGSFWYPTGGKTEDGVPVLRQAGFLQTVESRRKADPDYPSGYSEQIIDEHYSGNGPDGRFDVHGSHRQIQEGEQWATIGHTSLSVDGEVKAESNSGVRTDLAGQTLVEFNAGTQDKAIRSLGVKIGGHGDLESTNEVRAPYTNERVSASTSSVETLNVPGSDGSVLSETRDMHGDVLSYDQHKVGTVTQPSWVHLPGITGPVRVMTESEYDPSKPGSPPIHSRMLAGEDGNVFAQTTLPDGSTHQGHLSWKGDGNGHYVYDIEGLSHAHIQQGAPGHEQFASDLQISGDNKMVLRNDSKGGTRAAWEHTRNDDIRYSLSSNIIGADALTSGSDPLLLSDNQRIGMEVQSAIGGVSEIAQDAWSIRRGLGKGRSGGSKSPGPATSKSSGRKTGRDVRSGINDQMPAGRSADSARERNAMKSLAKEVEEWKASKDAQLLQ